MQITNNYFIHNNIYKNYKNNYVSFKSNLEKTISPKVMSKLKNAVKSEGDIFWFEKNFEFIKQYVVPPIFQKVDSSIKNVSLNKIIVPKEQLPELLGEKGHCYELSRLKGICFAATDNENIEKCNNMYDMTVVLVPDSTPEQVMKEIVA